MFDICEELKQFDRKLENARALAVLGYAQASLSKQRYLRLKYVHHLEVELPGSNITIDDIEGEPVKGNYGVPSKPLRFPDPPDYDNIDRSSYAEEERARTRNISNHEYTEDMRLDDPRHTEGSA